MTDIKNFVKTMELDSNEHDYVLDCLKAAVSYCKSQYESSGVDWLPTVAFIGLQDEAAKFDILAEWLQTLYIV